MGLPSKIFAEFDAVLQLVAIYFQVCIVKEKCIFNTKNAEITVWASASKIQVTPPRKSAYCKNPSELQEFCFKIFC